MGDETDVVIIGAGLAGLVAACEAVQRGRRVILLDQENRANLGGQAFWSLGGLFMVNTPEQCRMRIRDSLELARTDWLGSAGFDRAEDHWPRLWAEAYLDFAAGEMRPWLHGLGMRWFPVVGWAERGGSLAHQHGNAVPRFHVTWGTGPGVLAPFIRQIEQAEAEGRIALRFRHRVTALTGGAGGITGVQGEVLADDPAERGQPSNRQVIRDFAIRAGAVIVASGGIGGNEALVRQNWPAARLGPAPESMVCGVPAHVDGLMIGHAQAAGARVINNDRMWHYTEGIRNWNPIWPNHGIRILPGPSSMWFDADGSRLPAPCLPGFDSLSTLRHLCQNRQPYSWFITTQKIIKKEFALSGSEQNPDMTGKNIGLLLRSRLGRAAPPPVEAFKTHGEDFVVADRLDDLVAGMNRIGDRALSAGHLRGQIEARDAALNNPFSKDAQIIAIRQARAYLGDRFMRTARPHPILDPKSGPLIAVRLHVLTRKTLGGLETDLSGQALDGAGRAIPGLFACGEAAGFGGGGYHGYNALEGTFLGGCIFSGRAAGRAALA
ncbi:MAG: FAD-binding dehydrogenase [Paracoccus sp. (in: a-proteobacteria)]|uniref:FAD-binding dehydrogenase n=1 Tax=Paracoccus sp. TaxID=267 RepID=UPI0026E0172F|nr:FAD-binding dehydrogenase [Paracoccus sp. (in: a-proteobacteria)]MDO5620605.1 FAD-binding dehydrogenase [Paracoccus sp. (in: a-proteobacteria)]